MKSRTDTIYDIREFNRFYTNILGLLDRRILGSGYSLTEARILYELNETGRCIANELTVRLRIDKSYLSRILAGFEKKGLVRREPSPDDSRSYRIELTEEGVSTVRRLNERSDRHIRRLLLRLSDAECGEVRAAMDTIQTRLSGANDVNIRPYRDSDVDFVITNQIALYEREYGFTAAAWKAYVTDAVRRFAGGFDEARDCMYILEYRGVLSGCVAIAHAGDRSAQLRFFFLEKAVRGLGLGGRLMDLAIAFCREKHYRHVFLWTCSKLDAARYLYGKHGFRIAEARENDEWGEPMVEERWELDLS